MQNRRNFLKWLPGVGVALAVPVTAALPEKKPKFDLEKMIGYAECVLPMSGDPVYPFFFGTQAQCPRCGAIRLIPFEYSALILSGDPPVLTNELSEKFYLEREAKWGR